MRDEILRVSSIGDRRVKDFIPKVVNIEKRLPETVPIEWLLMQMPFPLIYAVYKEDGIQVLNCVNLLSIIASYLDNNFKLSGLHFLEEFEGKSFSQLEPWARRRIEDYTFRVHIIDSSSKPSMENLDTLIHMLQVLKALQ